MAPSRRSTNVASASANWSSGKVWVWMPSVVTAPALALMANGAVTTEGIHTHTFPLDQFAEALATFVERRDGAMKVVLEP